MNKENIEAWINNELGEAVEAIRIENDIGGVINTIFIDTKVDLLARYFSSTKTHVNVLLAGVTKLQDELTKQLNVSHVIINL